MASFPSGPIVVDCPGMFSPWRSRAKICVIKHNIESVRIAEIAYKVLNVRRLNLTRDKMLIRKEVCGHVPSLFACCIFTEIF